MSRRILIAGLALAALNCAGPGALTKKPAVDDAAAYTEEWRACPCRGGGDFGPPA